MTKNVKLDEALLKVRALQKRNKDLKAQLQAREVRERLEDSIDHLRPLAEAAKVFWAHGQFSHPSLCEIRTIGKCSCGLTEAMNTMVEFESILEARGMEETPLAY